MGMTTWYRRGWEIAPIALQEVSLLVVWLLATPEIGNYQAVKNVFEPIWYTCISAGFLVRWWILYVRQEALPRALRWLVHVPLLPLLVLWAFILAGEMRIIDARYPVALLGFGALVAGLHRVRRLHGVALTALLLLLAVLALRYQIVDLIVVYLGLLVLFTLGGVLFGRSIYQAPAWLCSLAFTNLWVAFLGYHFTEVHGTRIAQLSSHPGVERLFLVAPSDPVARQVGGNIMTVQEGCDPETYLVASHSAGVGVVLVDRARKLVRPHPTIREASNDILVDCARREAIVGSFSEPWGLHFLSLDDWPAASRPMMPIPGHGVVYIVFDQANDQYVVFPKHQEIFAVDARTGQIEGRLPGPDERAYDSRRNQLTSLTEPDFSIVRVAIGGPPGPRFRVLERRSMGVPVYKRLQMYFHPGPEEGTTLVTSLWDGTLTLYDEDLLPVRRERVAPGVSGLLLTPDRRHILVGGYTDGYLYFLDAESWEVVTRLYLGHRMRELRLSRDGRRVYVGSSQGGFRIDLQRVLEDALASSGS
jgi:hypothetical protein